MAVLGTEADDFITLPLEQEIVNLSQYDPRWGCGFAPEAV